MSGWRRNAGLPDTSDRSGPKCREMFGGSVAATLRQEFPAAAVSPALSIQPSANRKRLRSIFRVFHSVRGELGLRVETTCSRSLTRLAATFSWLPMARGS